MVDKKARTTEAFALLKEGKDQEARAILEELVRGDVADAAVLETLGDVREKLGDKAGALDAYSGAVTHLRFRGELRRALGVLELMMIVDDQNFSMRREAAEVRAELGDAEGCWREITAAAEVGLAHKQTRRVVVLCEDHAELLPEAAPALHVARRLEHVQRSDCVRLCMNLGAALRRRGKEDEALALFAFALDLEPSNRALLHARAGALVSTGRFAEARVVVDRLLSLDPTDLVAIRVLERVAEALGDDVGVRAARERFEKTSRTLGRDREDMSGHEGERELTSEEQDGNALTEDTSEHLAVHRADTDDDPTDLER